jgi:plastocyanin
MPGTLPPPAPPNGLTAVETVELPPLSDQERFDATVDRDSRIVLQILLGVGVLAALVMSTVALVLASDTPGTTATTSANASTPAVASVAPASAPISVTVAGSNKRGPDGKMHDSFSKTDFAVKVGQPTTLRIDNQDANSHSITAPGTGVSIVVLPGIHSYTINATTAGRFQWICIIPCDSETNGWAMTHPGYMAGYITAT